jgi:hypothetical protein
MNNVALFQNFAKEQRETAVALAGDIMKRFQVIAVAHSDLTHRSLQDAAAFFEKMTSVKSFDQAFEVHAEYKKTAYETFVAESKKITEVYADLAKNSFKFEGLIAKPPASV